MWGTVAAAFWQLSRRALRVVGRTLSVMPPTEEVPVPFLVLFLEFITLKARDYADRYSAALRPRPNTTARVPLAPPDIDSGHFGRSLPRAVLSLKTKNQVCHREAPKNQVCHREAPSLSPRSPCHREARLFACPDPRRHRGRERPVIKAYVRFARVTSEGPSTLAFSHLPLLHYDMGSGVWQSTPRHRPDPGWFVVNKKLQVFVSS